jgi:hypothetical protein
MHVVQALRKILVLIRFLRVPFRTEWFLKGFIRTNLEPRDCMWFQEFLRGSIWNQSGSSTISSEPKVLLHVLISSHVVLRGPARFHMEPNSMVLQQ